jgi:uncharacterized protein
MTKKYQVYKDVKGKFRFRLEAENGKIVAVGEAYEQHESCIKGIKSIQTNCNAEIEDSTIKGAAKIVNPKYLIFKDTQGKFRFHLTAKNGEIIAQSEGYEAKAGCLNGVKAVRNSCDATIEDLTATQKPKEETVHYDEIPEPKAEPKVELPPAVVAAPQAAVMAPPVETPIPAYTGPTETIVALNSLAEAKKGETVSFQGKLFRSDSGKGIPNSKIEIWERDRSLLGDDYLAFGNTSEDGSFSVAWKARPLAWFDNTGQIYARFKGNEQAKPSKSVIQTITIK